jgi:phenylalanyl-tRNA synthetase beta chain
MKFPESWLRELVPLEASREELVQRLTMSGLEVEAVTPLGEGLDGIVIAEIVECAPHPDADRLRVCSVDAGDGERLAIVCGAPNARAGLKAPLAKIGTVLPGGMEIKAAKLRGVASNGMLCSSKELRIDEEATGLMELPPDAPVGTPLADYLGLPDATLELKLTPNRADCFSLQGLAFDVAAQFGSAATPVDAAPVPAVHERTLEIRLEAGADCPRYCGRLIEGLDPTAPSPLWLKQRLRRSGLRPISAVVDVTNYVMLELGQPLHAFDADTLQGAIVVRHGRSCRGLKLLDERSVDLDEDVLVIADERGAVAMAGVMGGWDTRVTDATRRVFLESAHFAPAAIAGRARRFGLHTDASHRFERGVDPELPRRALERATALLLAVAGGQPGPVNEAMLPQYLAPPAPVRLRRTRLARVLGLSIADAEVERILRALGMAVQPEGEGWQVTAPTSRFDIAREEDLVEEVVRVHGYERVPTHAPSGELRLGPLPEGQVADGAWRRQLAARGFTEALNYAFLDEPTLRHWGFEDRLVRLANPLSADLAVMRPALLPGLVAALARNLARQQPRVRLFELGRVFRATDGAPIHADRERAHQDGPTAAPLETRRLAAVAFGPARAEQWGAPRRGVDFFDLKGDLESLLALTGAADGFTFEPATDVPWLHPGRAARVMRDAGGQRTWVGCIGHLHPQLTAALDLAGEVVAFELILDPVAARAVPRAAPQSRFPSLRRDLSVVVAEDVPWAALEASLRGALGGLLREVVLFDQFQGGALETGCKSLAMGLILQDVSRTLTDLDADQAQAAAVAALARDCGASLRG